MAALVAVFASSSNAVWTAGDPKTVVESDVYLVDRVTDDPVNEADAKRLLRSAQGGGTLTKAFSGVTSKFGGGKIAGLAKAGAAKAQAASASVLAKQNELLGKIMQKVGPALKNVKDKAKLKIIKENILKFVKGLKNKSTGKGEKPISKNWRTTLDGVQDVVKRSSPAT